MFGSVSTLASESVNVAAIVYNAFETPITLILAVIGTGFMISIIVRSFMKQ